MASKDLPFINSENVNFKLVETKGELDLTNIEQGWQYPLKRCLTNQLVGQTNMNNYRVYETFDIQHYIYKETKRKSIFLVSHFTLSFLESISYIIIRLKSWKSLCLKWS